MNDSFARRLRAFALLVVVGGGATLAFAAAVDLSSLADLWFGRRLRLNPGQTEQLEFIRRQLLVAGGFGVAAGLLLLAYGRRMAGGFAAAIEADPPPAARYAPLALASFASLYFEVVLIRWVSTEIRVLAFFKNVPLIAAYLGLGMGCLLASRVKRLDILFLPALAVFVAGVGLGSDTYLRALSFAGATVGGGDLLIWGHTFSDSWRPLAALVFYGGLAALFAAQVALFVPLGHAVGRGFAGLPRLAAYSVNIGFSLAGIYAYSFLSHARTGPILWFGLGALPVLWLVRDRRREAWLSAALLAAALVALSITAFPRVWSPYNRLSLADSWLWSGPDGTGKTYPERESDLRDAEGREGEWVSLGKRLDVGDLFYMDLHDFSERFRAAHPRLYGNLELYTYNLPYTLLAPRSVLVVGAGGGNDVAAALRGKAESVVAVEIDPVIAEFGGLHHPESPYRDARVEVVVDDARHYFQTTQRRFDLVVFGVLDSHSLFSTFSSIRLDNYVYTVEAFQRVRDLLSPGGSVACTFAVKQPWLLERFARMFEAVFGRPPVIANTGRGITFLTGLRDDYADLAREAGLSTEPPPATAEGSALPLTTDDWPFLYQKERSLPVSFLGGLLVMLAVGTGWLWRLLRPEERKAKGQGQMFWLGVAFLLFEVKAISQLALVWGSTWKVTAIVIGGIMALILLANLAVARLRPRGTNPAYLLLIASLIGSWWLGVDWSTGGGFWWGQVAPTAVLLGPVFFAAVVFAHAFRAAERPEAALGWNLLGGVLGGFLEYASVATGLGFMTLAAAAAYGASWICAPRGRPEEAPAPVARGSA